MFLGKGKKKNGPPEGRSDLEFSFSGVQYPLFIVASSVYYCIMIISSLSSRIQCWVLPFVVKWLLHDYQYFHADLLHVPPPPLSSWVEPISLSHLQRRSLWFRRLFIIVLIDDSLRGLEAVGIPTNDDSSEHGAVDDHHATMWAKIATASALILHSPSRGRCKNDQYKSMERGDSMQSLMCLITRGDR